MSFLEKKIPPPALLLLFAVLIYLLSRYSYTLSIDALFKSVIAGLFVLASLCFSFAGVFTFKRHQTTVNPIQPELASTLVKTGIYRYSRNPMYLGMVCMLVALSVFFASPLSLLGVFGFMLYLGRFQIRPEEQALESIFGSEYLDYKSQTRRWL
jgi:protein-S-isoprenylcysteine O-methyltransferase Ste14